MALPGTGRRVGLEPFAFLLATDAIAAATFARCFSGPGELAVILPTCLGAQLLAGLPRRLAARRAGPTARRVIGLAGVVCALVLAFLLPLALVDGSSLTAGLPLAHTWSVVSPQLSVAWRIFSNQLAPVAESPGLVLAAAWAAGAVGLAAELLYADVGLPAVVALVPAFDLVVFTGTLGTSTGRVVELVGICGASLAFLGLAAEERRTRRTVLMSRVAGGQPAAGRRRRAVPGVAVAAALAAGVVGPVLPGATSAPLVAWHGVAGRSRAATTAGGEHLANTIGVSTLVQVAEREIDNSDALLLTVHSAVRTREVLATLDQFNGNQWSELPASYGGSIAVRQVTTAIGPIEKNPPAPKPDGPDAVQVEQVIEVGALGGEWLPTPGIPLTVDGDGQVSEVGWNGPTATLAPLTDGLTYAVTSEVDLTAPPPAGSRLTAGDRAELAPDLLLPEPVPATLIRLAHSIVAGATSEYAKAEALQQYFLAGHGFTYELPRVAPSGAIADTSAGYRALEAFLFETRTGYCQQYATSFAVLARIAGLPTRLAVGLLPGPEIGRDTYEVTGTDVHVWPEVYFAGVGWETFEPTPGTTTTLTGPTTTTTSSLPRSTSSTVTTTSVLSGHHFAKPPAGGGRAPLAHHRHHRAGGPGRSSGLALFLSALAALAALWAVAVPFARAVAVRRGLADPRRATARAWQSALAVLALAGAHRRRSETHREFAQRVRTLGLVTDAAAEALGSLAVRMDELCYAPADGRSGDGRAAVAESAAVRRAARRRVAWWQLAVLALDPRDLFAPS